MEKSKTDINSEKLDEMRRSMLVIAIAMVCILILQAYLFFASGTTAIQTLKDTIKKQDLQAVRVNTFIMNFKGELDKVQSVEELRKLVNLRLQTRRPDNATQ